MPSLPRRPFVLLALTAAVVVLHGVALTTLGPGLFDPPARAPSPPAMMSVTVRSVVPPAAAEATPTAPVADRPRPATARAPRVAPRAPAALADAPRAEVVASAPAWRAPEEAVLTLVAVQAANAAPIEAEASTLQVPVYPTQLPPPGLWRYRMQRGLIVGEGEMQWSVDDAQRYALRLQGRVLGVAVLDWASRGALDAAGVAPERFVIRRRGRDVQAANFQRAAGKITFSGPGHEAPLPAGAQDRLSWMVQLAGIVAAQPERLAQPGTRIALFVAGARGDADVWTFAVQGHEAVDGVQALMLLREPRKPFDTRVEVWLDPGVHHLPVRVRLTEGRGGPSLELLRQRD